MTIAIVNIPVSMGHIADPELPKRRTYGGLTAAERAAARRERLLDAALELYGTRGFLATGVKDICRQAGLTDRYFYESFTDGSELFVAAFDRVTTDLLLLVAGRVGELERPTPETQVRAAIGAFVGALAEDPRKARLIFSEAASAGPAVERHMRSTLRQFAGLVAATARAHLPGGVPEHVLQMGALALVGAIDRVIIEWQEGTLDANLDQVTDFLVELFLVAGRSVGVSGTRPARP